MTGRADAPPVVPAGPDDPPEVAQRRPVEPGDLLLVLPAAACWSVAAWAVARPARDLVVAGAAVALVVAGLVAAGVVAVRRGRPPRALGVLLAGVCVLAVLAVQAEAAARRDGEPVAGWARDRAAAQVHAVASGDAVRVRSAFPAAAPRFVVRVSTRAVEARGSRAEVRVPVLVVGGPAWAGVAAGSPVAFRARLGPPDGPADGVAAVASAISAPDVGRAGAVWRVADRVRAGLREACSGLGEDARGLLPALVVGDTSALPDALVADLRTAGLTHLTAVSGANVAIVAGAVLWLVSQAGAGRSARLWLTIAAVAGFVVLARPQPSVLRAAVMGSVGLAGLLRARRVRGVPLVAAAVVVLTVAVPRLSRSPGFALSVTATLALVLLAPAWAARLERVLPRPLALAVAVPAAAQAACGPIVVLLDPALSTTAVPANLLAAPAVPVATVCGVVAAVVSVVWPGAAAAVAWCGGLAAGWIAGVAHRAAAVPGAALPWPPGPAGAALLAGLTVAVVLLTLRVAPVARPTPGGPATGGPAVPAPGGPVVPGPAARRRSRADRGSGSAVLTAGVAAVLLALGAGWLLAPAVPVTLPGGTARDDGWALALCDVGQGDMLVLRSGPASAVVVDVGPDPPAADRCLRRLGVRTLDLVVLTHFHADHVDGLPGALRRRAVGPVLVSGFAQPAFNARAVGAQAAAAGATVRAAGVGESGSVGSGGWSVGWRVVAAHRPATTASSSEAEGSDVNESSLVTEMVVGGPGGALRVVGLGDLEATGQAALAAGLRSGGVLLGGPVDVVKVAHHGSPTQDPDLYATLSAPVALVGVGADNDYGHPAQRTLDLLRAAGSTVLRTDTSGTVRLVATPQGVGVLR